MNQTKLESLLETGVNTFSGVVISVIATKYIIVPMYDLDWDIGDDLNVTLIFTAISIARSYFWRRFFNAGVHKLVHNIIKQYYRSKS